VSQRLNGKNIFYISGVCGVNKSGEETVLWYITPEIKT